MRGLRVGTGTHGSVWHAKVDTAASGGVWGRQGPERGRRRTPPRRRGGESRGLARPGSRVGPGREWHRRAVPGFQRDERGGPRTPCWREPLPRQRALTCPGPGWAWPGGAYSAPRPGAASRGVPGPGGPPPLRREPPSRGPGLPRRIRPHRPNRRQQRAVGTLGRVGARAAAGLRARARLALEGCSRRGDNAARPGRAPAAASAGGGVRRRAGPGPCGAGPQGGGAPARKPGRALPLCGRAGPAPCPPTPSPPPSARRCLACGGLGGQI